MILDVSPSLNRKPTEPPRFEKIIKLGDTEQSVLSALGAPSKIFYKSDEKMLIQRGPSQVKIDDDKPDMFFNYFTMGTVGLCFCFYCYWPRIQCQNIQNWIQFFILAKYENGKKIYSNKEALNNDNSNNTTMRYSTDSFKIHIF